MTNYDFFGLEKEEKIKKSGVRNVFTPHTPVHSIRLFCGREDDVSRLIEYLNTPGQHALLYGERGVGKSSIANVTAELLLDRKLIRQLLFKRCDSSDNFVSIVSQPLHEVGIDVSAIEIETRSESGTGSVPYLPSLGKGKSIKKTGSSVNAKSPSWVAQKLADLDALLMIDEFDVINDASDKKRIAELIKHLSDLNSKFKIIIVGIAETATELTLGHPSVQRCLKELRIERMRPLDLKAVLEAGQKKLGLTFTNEAMSRIINVSSGYPHFTHLLALKAAEDAILDDRKEIDVDEVQAATNRAVEDSEGTLKIAYDTAIRSAYSDFYKKILLAASLCNIEEIRSSQLREKYQQVHGVALSQGQLNNHFGRLVSNDSSTILRRISKGVYRFSDPRMPSFIRIAQSYLQT